MSFDLLSVPQGHVADFVLVISPYFDAGFAKELVRRLRPQQVYFLVDDGARSEDIVELRQAFPRRVDVQIGLAGAAGLVHLKGIYIRSRPAEGRRTWKRKFLFGSANATVAAFCGRNAELLSVLELKSGKDADLIAYLEGVAEAISNEGGKIEKGSYGPVSLSPTLHLPGFRISMPGPPPGFDAWLQRGRLAAKYRDAQGFLTVPVRLKAPFPAGVLDTTFSARRLIEQGERNLVRYPYLGDVEPADGDTPAAHMWSSRFGIWSHLGIWMSESCYEEHRRRFVTRTSAERRAKLEDFRENGDNEEWQDARRREYLAALSGVWQDLEANDLAKPSDYLEGGNSQIDKAFYRDRFDRKIQSDLLMARDEDFFNRYVSGYEFPDVPRFRQDQQSWNSFALSVCASIAVEATKRGTTSLITKAVASAMEASGEQLGELFYPDILDWLRRRWDKKIKIEGVKTTVGEHIAGYWQVPA